jgi:diguanylate cyclase (GGDEF)-like protein
MPGGADKMSIGIRGGKHVDRRMDPLAAQWRARAEHDLLSGRWGLLAAAALILLLLPGRLAHPHLGWIAVGVGLAANGALAYLARYRPLPVSASLFIQLLFTTLLLLYTAALPGGIASHLPLLSMMLVVATIRFGGWGAAGSGLLALAITAGLYFSGAYGQSGLALGSTAIALAVDGVLLGYLIHLAREEHFKQQADRAQLQKHISEITILHEVSSAAHDLKSEDALQDIVDIVTGFMRFRRAALFLTDSVGDGVPQAYHSHRRAARGVSSEPLSIAPALFETVLQHQGPIAIDGSQGRPDMAHAAALQIAVPLHGDTGPIGVLLADSNGRRRTLRSDMVMLSSLAKSAVVAIENASLHRRVARMANHDGVTGLYNHRYFQERLRELLREAEEKWPVSLLMVEIDQFKHYNDSFGHRQGDTALYSLSRALEQSTAPFSGTVARYGGDEFVVILPHIGCQEALLVAGEIRDETYDVVSGLLAAQQLPTLSLSIGVATLPDDAHTAAELIEAADQAMYTVKRSGGNGIHACAWSEVTTEGT